MHDHVDEGAPDDENAFADVERVNEFNDAAHCGRLCP